MNKRQSKKKNKNQFDAYCHNYKEKRVMKKNFARAEQKHKFKARPKTSGEVEFDIVW